MAYILIHEGMYLRNHEEGMYLQKPTGEFVRWVSNGEISDISMKEKLQRVESLPPHQLLTLIEKKMTSASVVIQRLELGLIDRAITIMDGTELFNNPSYQEAKAKWESGLLATDEFRQIVESLYRDLAKKYGLEFE